MKNQMKNMCFGIAGFLIGSLSIVGANQAIQAIQNTQIKISLNGQVQNFKDEKTDETQYPITYNDRTYLPLRNVANLAGLSVDYDSATNTALLKSEKGFLDTETGLFFEKYHMNNWDQVRGLNLYGFNNGIMELTEQGSKDYSELWLASFPVGDPTYMKDEYGAEYVFVSHKTDLGHIIGISPIYEDEDGNPESSPSIVTMYIKFDNDTYGILDYKEMNKEIKPITAQEIKLRNNATSSTSIDDKNDSINENNVRILRPSNEIDELFKNEQELNEKYEAEIMNALIEVDLSKLNKNALFYSNFYAIGDAPLECLSQKYITSTNLMEKHNDGKKSEDFQIDDPFVNGCWAEGVDGAGIGQSIEIDAFGLGEHVAWQTQKDISDVTFEDMINNLPIGENRNLEYLIDEAGNKIRISDITKDNMDNYLYTFVNKIFIINGNAETEETWKDNNRIKRLKLIIDDKETYYLDMEDTRTLKVFDIDYKTPISKQAKFRFEIEEVYKGEKYDDTCISALYLDGGSNVPYGGR